MEAASRPLSPATPNFLVSERYWAGPKRLLRLLADAATAEPCRHTVYLPPRSLASPVPAEARARDAGLATEVATVVRHAGDSDTGVVSFWWHDRALAVVPPFPLKTEAFLDGADVSHLANVLNSGPLVGVILLRLGRYAVGVVQGESLLASKSGSRYVKSRHRAGGSSQRRFERSRERLVRELFDKTCQVARDVFAPFDGRIDYLLMGGERHTLQGFARRCPLVDRPDPLKLDRTLGVERPGLAALQNIHNEVLKSKVLVLTREERD